MPSWLLLFMRKMRMRLPSTYSPDCIMLETLLMEKIRTYQCWSLIIWEWLLVVQSNHSCKQKITITKSNLWIVIDWFVMLLDSNTSQVWSCSVKCGVVKTSTVYYYRKCWVIKLNSCLEIFNICQLKSSILHDASENFCINVLAISESKIRRHCLIGDVTGFCLFVQLYTHGYHLYTTA